MITRAWLRCTVLVLGLSFGGAADLAAQGLPAAAPVVTGSAELHPWVEPASPQAPVLFRFAVVADRTGGHRNGVFEQAMAGLALLRPEFVLCVGDLIEGYSADRQVIRQEWSEVERLVGGLGARFYFVPGNHDLSNQVEVEEWQARFGPTYYQFVRDNVLFLCLNTEDPPPTHISPEQVAFVAQALREHAGVRWVAVFMHRPLWLHPQDTGWTGVEALLQDRPHTVFAGHWHTYTKYERHGRDYYTLATTGGGSELSGPIYGKFDHVVWVTMTDAGPQVANLMLDGIRDKDLRTERMAALVASVSGGAAVGLGPVFCESREFRGGTAQLRLTNGADLPMTVRGRFRPSTALIVVPDTLARTVPPGAVEIVGLQVRPVRGKAAVADLPPLVVDWQVAFDQAPAPPLVIPGTSKLAVERRLECPAGAAKAVDGDLGDWQRLAHLCERPAEIRGAPGSWHGPSDGSYRFGVEHDQEFLYLGIEVTDDRLVLDPTANPWEQDGVEVRIDARPDPDRSAGHGQGENTDFVFVGLSPGETSDQMVYYERAEVEALGVRAACVRTGRGFAAEIAVPRAYLDGKQGGGWDAVRINVAVDDVDEPNGSLAQLWWRPDWRWPDNLPGSGTFVRR